MKVLVLIARVVNEETNKTRHTVCLGVWRTSKRISMRIDLHEKQGVKWLLDRTPMFIPTGFVLTPWDP